MNYRHLIIVIIIIKQSLQICILFGSRTYVMKYVPTSWTTKKMVCSLNGLSKQSNHIPKKYFTDNFFDKIKFKRL